MTTSVSLDGESFSTSNFRTTEGWGAPSGNVITRSCSIRSKGLPADAAHVTTAKRIATNALDLTMALSRSKATKSAERGTLNQDRHGSQQVLRCQKSICKFSRTYRAGRMAVGVSQMLPRVAVGAE